MKTGNRIASLVTVALAVSGLFLVGGTANAGVLLDDHFDNGDLATGGVNGGFELLSNNNGVATVVESGSVAAITTGAHDNGAAGIESLNTFDPTSVTSFTVTWVIESAEQPILNNGFMFTVDDAPGMWGSGFVFMIQADSTLRIYDGYSNQNTYPLGTVTLSELADGFTLSITYDNTGMSWTATDAPSLVDGSITWEALNGVGTYASFDATMYVHTVLAGNAKAYNVDRITVETPGGSTPGTLIYGK